MASFQCHKCLHGASPRLPEARRQVLPVCQASRGREEAGRSRRKSKSTTQRGFGAAPPSPATNRAPEPAQDDNGIDDVIQDLRSEYQMYADPDYKPQRFIGSVEVATIEGRGRGLVTTSAVDGAELLVLSPSLFRLEGQWRDLPPESEELHMAWMEEGMKPAQRRVLDMLYDGTPESMTRPASLTTLDTKFWANRGKNDPQAPQVSSGRLLSIIQEGASADMEQDTAAMTLRHQKPNPYIGLWPEYTLLNHSCVPNVAITVIKDRMLIHAADSMPAGQELVRNYIPHMATKPAAQRQAALEEAGYAFKCNCPRCRLEARVSQEVRDVLDSANSWYTEVAAPRFSGANELEDLPIIKELLEEAQLIVNEVEEAVEAEPGLTEEERTLLRACAYDAYDMLVTCDEFANREKASLENLLPCLELIQAIAPGSESHVAVALKYDEGMKNRMQLLDALVKRGRFDVTSKKGKSEYQACLAQADLSAQYYLNAWVTRYGYCGFPTLQGLTEAYQVYLEGLEQLSYMEVTGQTETVSELEINGVKVSVVDKMDLESSSADQAGGQAGDEIQNKNGVRVMLMQDTVQQVEEETAQEDGSVTIDVDHTVVVEEEEVQVQAEQQVQEVVQAQQERLVVTSSTASQSTAGAAQPEAAVAAAAASKPVRKLRLRRKQL